MCGESLNDVLEHAAVSAEVSVFIPELCLEIKNYGDEVVIVSFRGSY